MNGVAAIKEYGKHKN